MFMRFFMSDFILQLYFFHMNGEKKLNVQLPLLLSTLKCVHQTSLYSFSSEWVFDFVWVGSFQFVEALKKKQCVVFGTEGIRISKRRF